MPAVRDLYRYGVETKKIDQISNFAKMIAYVYMETLTYLHDLVSLWGGNSDIYIATAKLI